MPVICWGHSSEQDGYVSWLRYLYAGGEADLQEIKKWANSRLLM